MTATALLGEITRRGARVEVVDGSLHVRPRRAVIDLAPEIQRHARELAAAIVSAPPTEPRVWIVASDSDGEMRLAVAADPLDWPDEVYRAAALVEVCDRHHRAGEDRLAEAVAVQLEAVLEQLRRDGVEAWLTS